jgi:hypothetical protein
MIKTLISGLKSLTINGNLIKWIGLSIPVGTMIYVKNIDSPVSFFAFYLAIPVYLYMLGMANTEKPKRQNKTAQDNNAQFTNYNTINENDNIPMDINPESNALQVVDKIERKIITTSRQEEIETVYFKNGVPANIRKEMSYFD